MPPEKTKKRSVPRRFNLFIEKDGLRIDQPADWLMAANLWIEKKRWVGEKAYFCGDRDVSDSCDSEKVWVSPLKNKVVFNEVMCGNYTMYTNYFATLDKDSNEIVEVNFFGWLGNDHLGYGKISYDIATATEKSTYMQYSPKTRDLVMMDICTEKEKTILVEKIKL